MPEITESELKKQIEKSEFSNLYLLYGEESYLVGDYARKLMHKAKGSTFEDFNLQRFDGDTVAMDAVAAAVEALPFMSDRKCVAISDLDVERLRTVEYNKLEQIIDSVPSTTVLIIYLPSVSVNLRTAKKWKKFLTAVNKRGCVVQMKRRSGSDLEKLICSRAAKLGCELSRQDAGRMIRYSGNDMQTLMNETEKLCSFVKEGKISTQVIDRLVVKNLEARVYDLSKAILSGQYDRAYEILDLLFYQNEEPVSVLAVLSSAYVDIYRVRVSIQSGFSALEPAKHFDYARKEFRLTNAERDSKRLSTAMLRESLRVLLQADTALKGARGDRRIVMEKLLAQLLYIAEREKSA